MNSERYAALKVAGQLTDVEAARFAIEATAQFKLTALEETGFCQAETVDTGAQFSDAAKRGAQELRAKSERNSARGKHDGRTEKHGLACEGCQILGLMAQVDRLRAVIENAPHAPGCVHYAATWQTIGEPCTCWKADAL